MQTQTSSIHSIATQPKRLAFVGRIWEGEIVIASESEAAKARFDAIDWRFGFDVALPHRAGKELSMAAAQAPKGVDCPAREAEPQPSEITLDTGYVPDWTGFLAHAAKMEATEDAVLTAAQTALENK